MNVERAHTFLAGVLPQYDWESEHLRGTPQRFAQLLSDLTSNHVDWKFTTFQSDVDEMIIVKDVAFYSLCAHHLIPFFGTAAVAYVPQGKIAGLSKLVRTIQTSAKTLTSQEQLTWDIHDLVDSTLHPLGTAVSMQARHLCMEMRGVRSPGSATTTQKLSGCFREKPEARAEFLSALGRT